MPTVTARGLSQAGLSSLCKSLLGKPLDKSMQLSDCEQTPATHRQAGEPAPASQQPPAIQPARQPGCLPASLPPSLPACLPACQPACQAAGLPPCLPACLPAGWPSPPLASTNILPPACGAPPPSPADPLPYHSRPPAGEARPLTPRQVAYAALDAHSLVLLHEKLMAGLGDAGPLLAAQHTAAFRVGGPAGLRGARKRWCG
jgi:hypothetical protein